MATISHESLLQQLNWRYAVKKFDCSKKIDAKLWDTLEQALILTPSSYGLQPWKFLVIENPEIRAKLLGFSWNQKQVTDCAQFVVFTVLHDLKPEDIEYYFDVNSEIRGVSKDTTVGYKKMMVGDLIEGRRGKMKFEWATRQAYIALGNLMTCAAMLGIDACPMEGIDTDKYDEVLGLGATPYRTVVACAVGYRSPEDKYSGAKKIRYPKDRLIQKI